MRRNQIKWYICCEDEREIVEYRAKDVFYWRPRVQKTVLSEGSWTDASEDAYPGYCFVGSSRGWEHIERVLEIRLIRVSGVPYQLTEREVVSLRFFERVRFNLVPEVFREGDMVRVREERKHAFSGFVGRYVRPVPVVGGEQGMVEFDIFGQRVIRECVPADFLEKL